MHPKSVSAGGVFENAMWLRMLDGRQSREAPEAFPTVYRSSGGIVYLIAPGGRANFVNFSSIQRKQG